MIGIMFSLTLYGAGKKQSWNNELNLTNDQIQAHEVISDQFQKENIRIRAEIKILRLELKQVMKASSPDNVVLDRTLESISAKEAELEKNRVEYRMALRSMLTDDQKVIFDSRGSGFGMGNDHRGQRGLNSGGRCDGMGSGKGRYGKRHGNNF